MVNWRAGRTEQGGSSITQQVAKLAFLDSGRRYERKFREAALALALEWRFTKREILEIYLNRPVLGGGAFGFRAAAKLYFKKEPRDLSRAEAALLAGLLRAPSRWSPLSNFEAAQGRARVVVDAMLDAETITPTAHQAAYAEIAALQPPRVQESASYFVDWADAQIPEHFWKYASDLVVQTTLDPEAQILAEASIANVFSSELVSRRDADAEAAAVVLGLDGSVRAMVGGRDYAQSQFNRASQSSRQLGSAFKPFVYAAALDVGVSPASYVDDEPITIGDWSPKNYTDRYLGPIPITVALAKSSNVAAARLAQRAGVPRVVRTTQRFGFKEEPPAVRSLALGVMQTNPLEVASAYATIARSGRITPAYGVTEIRARGGSVLWRRREPEPRQAISRVDAEYLTGMLRTVVQYGTGRRADLPGHPVAGKTGTTQDHRDAWFAGFTGSHVAVVWMGKDDFTPLAKVTGGRVPAQIWRDAMEPLHAPLQVAALSSRSAGSFDEMDFSPELEQRAAAFRRLQDNQRAAERLERQRAAEQARRTARSDRRRRAESAEKVSRRFRERWRRRFRD